MGYDRLLLIGLIVQVDRSNGFEKLWFRKQNERHALKDEWGRWEAGADD